MKLLGLARSTTDATRHMVSLELARGAEIQPITFGVLETAAAAPLMLLVEVTEGKTVSVLGLANVLEAAAQEIRRMAAQDGAH